MENNLLKKNNNIIKDFYKSLNFIQNDYIEIMSASALVVFTEHYLNLNANNLNDDWFKNQANFFFKMKTNEDENIFIAELFPNKDKTIVEGNFKYHIISQIMFKDFENCDKILENYIKNIISIKEKFPINNSTIMNQLWNIYKNKINDKKLINDFITSKYIWFSLINKKFYEKNSVFKILEINDRYFLVGCGFKTQNVIIEKKINYTFYILSFVIFILFLFSFIKFKLYSMNLFGNILFFTTSFFIYYIFISGLREPVSYEQETIERTNINQINLSIVATLCALLVAVNKGLEIKDFNAKVKYQSNILFAFLILIMSVLIQPYDNTGQSIYNIITLQKLVIVFILFVILITILSFLFKK